jgi:hypothetical protein
LFYLGQALLALVNSRRPMGTPALAINTLPHLMVADSQDARYVMSMVVVCWRAAFGHTADIGKHVLR